MAGKECYSLCDWYRCVYFLLPHTARTDARTECHVSGCHCWRCDQPLTLLPCAISCAWHSISGTILAGLYLRWDLRHPAAVKAAEAERAALVSESVSSEAVEAEAVATK